MEHSVCPHCGEPLTRFEVPPESGWQGDYQLACFNDDCPYYQRGWQHMQERYAVRASYRYRVDPVTGEASPLAVWSPTAVKDRILGEPDGEAESTASAAEPGEGEKA